MTLQLMKNVPEEMRDDKNRTKLTGHRNDLEDQNAEFEEDKDEDQVRWRLEIRRGYGKEQTG